MEWSTHIKTQESSGQVTIWGTLKALALGTLIGASGILCSQWLSGSPLLCTAVRSTLTMVTLTSLALAKPQDLVFGCEHADLPKYEGTQEEHPQALLVRKEIVQ